MPKILVAPPNRGLEEQHFRGRRMEGAFFADLGRHGIAIMATREGLSFESAIESDLGPVSDCVQLMILEGIEIHCMRDLTRGGLASALNEIASQAKVEIRVRESQIPVREDVRGACEILGLDPLYVANEGRFIVFLPKEQTQKALKIMNRFNRKMNLPEAALAGEVYESSSGRVTLTNQIGTNRILNMISGEQLPRIC